MITKDLISTKVQSNDATTVAILLGPTLFYILTIFMQGSFYAELLIRRPDFIMFCMYSGWALAIGIFSLGLYSLMKLNNKHPEPFNAIAFFAFPLFIIWMIEALCAY